MSGFTQALEAVLGVEGGYADHPADRGGATNYGVTQSTYDSWRADHDLTMRPVREIEWPEVRAIYHRRYWVAAKCDALPWPLSYVQFDSAVNHGIKWAWKLMQRALGVVDDGIPGPITMGAVQDADVAKTIRAHYRARTRYYNAIVFNDTSQRVFHPGWISRGLHVWERCIEDLPEAA